MIARSGNSAIAHRILRGILFLAAVLLAAYVNRGGVQADSHHYFYANYSICPRLVEGPRELAAVRGPKASELRISWADVSSTAPGPETLLAETFVTVVVLDDDEAIVSDLPLEAVFVHLDTVPQGRDLRIVAALTRRGHLLSTVSMVRLRSTRTRTGEARGGFEAAGQPGPTASTILATVQGLRASAPVVNPHTGAKLTWTAPASTANIQDFEIVRCTNSENAGQTVGCTGQTAVGTPAKTATTDTATGLTTGTQYHFRIRAKATSESGYSDSPWSATVSHTPNNVQLPAVAGLAASMPASNGHTSANLAWTAPTNTTYIANFEIQRCATSACSSPTSVGTPAKTATTDTATGLSPNTQYHFRIRAKATSGSGYSDSPWSATVSHTTSLAPRLPAVAGLTAAAPAANPHTSAKLTWTAPASTANIQDFEIVRCTNSENAGQTTACTGQTAVGTPAKTATTDTATGLTTGTQYHFRIRAKAASTLWRDSPWSATVSHTPNNVQLPAVAGLAAADGTNAETEINLTWTAPTNTTYIANFEIQRCANSTCSSTPGATYNPTKTATSHTATGLTDGTQYYFRIRAKATSGSGYSDSTWSAIVSHTTEYPEG